MRPDTPAATRRPLLASRLALALRGALLLLAVAGAAPAHAQNFARAFGGTTADLGRSVAVAPNGDVVVVGSFQGTVTFNPGGANSETRTSNGGNDVFVVRYDAIGAFVSAVTIGSAGADDGFGVAVDASGNAVVTGGFIGTVDFNPDPTATQNLVAPNNGRSNTFLARYDASGNFVSAVAFGGNDIDYGNGVAVAPNGDVVVAGTFIGTADFDPSPTATQNRTSNGSYDAFVARYDASGAFVSAVTFGVGGFQDYSYGVAVAPNGDAVATGSFQGTVDFDPSPTATQNRTSGGNSDVFVARYTRLGAFVSAVTFGVGGNDQGNGVAVDASGNAVVTGIFTGTVDFDPSPTATQNRTGAGSSDGFVARYTPAGDYVSAVVFGSTDFDGGRSVAVDAGGDVVATGFFRGTIDFDPGTDVQNRTSGGGSDVFVARYTPAGAFVSAVTFGASGETGLDDGFGVAVDASGNAVVTGYFIGTVDFDPSTGVESLTSAGGTDVFVARYRPDGTLPVELTAFNGTASGRTARLSWTTASETNNAGFVVERQTGQTWAEASGLIAGQGTTTERTDYTYDVDGLTAGTHTFRLRQSDTDGTIHLSETVTVEIGTDGETVVTVLGNGSRSPRVQIEGAGAVRAEVFDVLGRSVGIAYDGAVSGTVETPLPGLSAGAYVVRVVAGGRTTTQRVVVR